MSAFKESFEECCEIDLEGGKKKLTECIEWHRQKPSTVIQCKHFEVQRTGPGVLCLGRGEMPVHVCVCLLQGLWPNTDAL